MLNHIVLLKLKPDVNEDLVNEMYDQVRGLMKTIPEIASITGGKNISKERFNQGYTEGFVVIFRDISSRDEYLTHSDHVKVANDYVIPISEKVLVFDYEV
tara:strand:- start:7045 stop:7344 length:300 start_codon:yes stop_codon:yes gene_type:complete